MCEPKFSVVIPTRERCETLHYAINTILNQTYDDFELVVMDNASQDETKDVVYDFEDDRIKYYQSPERLSMQDNWELALSKVKGQYVTFIGDDDGFIPEGLSLSAKIVDAFPECMAIKWQEGHNYWWPNVIYEPNRNVLFATFGNTFHLSDSKKSLQMLFDDPVSYSDLPSVYHGIVKKELLAYITNKKGSYFLSKAVDVYSGIINAYFTENYIYSSYPLSVKGVSGKSAGTSHLFKGKKGEDIRKTYSEEYGEMGPIPKVTEEFRAIPCENIQLHIADCMMHTKKIFFPNDDTLTLNKRNTINSMFYTMRFDPESYDESLAEIKSTAKAWGISESSLNIPPQTLLFFTITLEEQFFLGDV